MSHFPFLNLSLSSFLKKDKLFKVACLFFLMAEETPELEERKKGASTPHEKVKEKAKEIEEQGK